MNCFITIYVTVVDLHNLNCGSLKVQYCLNKDIVCCSGLQPNIFIMTSTDDTKSNHKCD